MDPLLLHIEDMITDIFVNQKHCWKQNYQKIHRIITKNSTFLFTDKYNRNLNQITNITQSKQQQQILFFLLFWGGRGVTNERPYKIILYELACTSACSIQNYYYP